jgi:glutamyl-Q tRNA(Asp) synthetase
MVAAVASYLDAKAAGGEWLVRMEDLDPPREQPGAADLILRTLEAFGLEWDGPVLYQSQRGEAYAAALDRLVWDGLVFACACTRKDVAEGPYPGTCRNGVPSGRAARAWRVRVDGASIAFADRVQGRIHQDLPREVGDFVLRRADGLFAYQLAVVVDDAAQGITDVVRGADLLDSTPRQIYLQRLLGLPQPRYLHVPVATNAAGEKLSKQTGAPPVDPANAGPALCEVLRFLGFDPPEAVDPREILAWAEAHWGISSIVKKEANTGLCASEKEECKQNSDRADGNGDADCGDKR